MWEKGEEKGKGCLMVLPLWFRRQYFWLGGETK